MNWDFASLQSFHGSCPPNTKIIHRNKGVFYVKREIQPLPDNSKELLNHMTCGDIHPNSLEHFCALVEEVMVPILKNEANMAKFPQCISDGKIFQINMSTRNKKLHFLDTFINLNVFILTPFKYFMP